MSSRTKCNTFLLMCCHGTELRPAITGHRCSIARLQKAGLPPPRARQQDQLHVFVQVRLPPFLALQLQVVVQLRLDCANAGAIVAVTNRLMVANNRAFIGFPRRQILCQILYLAQGARAHKSSSTSGSPRHRPLLCNRSKCRDGPSGLRTATKAGVVVSGIHCV